jgi:hypothetical protein
LLFSVIPILYSKATLETENDHISEQVKKFISIEHKKQGSKKEKEKEKAFI